MWDVSPAGASLSSIIPKPLIDRPAESIPEGTASSAEGRALDAGSMLDQDGSIRMRTYPHGDGAMVGKYKETLSLGGGSSPKPAKYARPRTTTLASTRRRPGSRTWSFVSTHVKPCLQRCPGPHAPGPAPAGAGVDPEAEEADA